MDNEKQTKPVKEKKQKKEKVPKVKKIKQRDINLVTALKAAYAADERAKKKGRPSALVYFLGVIAVLGMAGFYVFKVTERDDLLSERDDMDFLVNSPLMTDQMDEAVQANLKNNYLDALEKKTAEDTLALKSAESQYEYYTDVLFSRIKAQFKNRITVTHYDLSNDTLIMDLTAEEISDAAEFVKRLREQDIFGEIAYEGFMESDEDGTATFSLVCKFKSPEAEESAPAAQPAQGGDE